ncbi:hypothetical protein PROFUN_00389 [Planoprotostelium fungivorum]|uniref:Uncharacterized protein n=1 Tax=Planoprotostelium fungivorum TaxID=1890364 RepID=A0A2P6NY85_9EUKA|nr:hypothetical protein PROFUN_00389 [Planoprotostelium fungivorum]
MRVTAFGAAVDRGSSHSKRSEEQHRTSTTLNTHETTTNN